MKIVNIHEAKAKLSECLAAVAKGERVLICKRNQPIAELRAIQEKRAEPRPIGLAKGTIKIPPSFFDPLPDDELDLYDDSPVFPAEAPGPAPAATRTSSRSSRRRARQRR